MLRGRRAVGSAAPKNFGQSGNRLQRCNVVRAVPTRFGRVISGPKFPGWIYCAETMQLIMKSGADDLFPVKDIVQLCTQIGFLKQFALCRFQDCLSRINLAARQSPQILVRLAAPAHQQHHLVMPDSDTDRRNRGCFSRSGHCSAFIVTVQTYQVRSQGI